MTTRLLLGLRMIELKVYRERSHSGLRPQSLSVFDTVISVAFFFFLVILKATYLPKMSRYTVLSSSDKS